MRAHCPLELIFSCYSQSVWKKHKHVGSIISPHNNNNNFSAHKTEIMTKGRAVTYITPVNRMWHPAIQSFTQMHNSKSVVPPRIQTSLFFSILYNTCKYRYPLWIIPWLSIPQGPGKGPLKSNILLKLCAVLISLILPGT